MDFGYIEKNLYTLISDIERSADLAGVKVPKLVAVTKSGSDEELLALIRAGAYAIGENRPGELARRGGLIKEAGLSVELHQIGTLQSNKAKLVAADATLIHSLDSHSLAKELDKQGKKLGIKIPALIEINSAKEPQKSGVLPEDAEEFLASVSTYESIKVTGLMTMGPVSDDPENLRPYFKLTKELFDKLNSRYGFGDTPTLSMGMSNSYRVAIEEGSTLIRVGRRLFIKE
jgi:pyridoxal phosphate enzyme (YggS family)